MLYYDTVGIGIKTNRKRHKTYFAENEEHVRLLAEKDETRIISISKVIYEHGPPTENQISYARHLNIPSPDSYNYCELSNLISARIHDDPVGFAPSWLLDYVWSECPSQKDIQFTKHASIGKLVGYVNFKYFGDKENDKMVHWFIYFVLRDRLSISWETSISCIYSEYPLGDISKELLSDSKALKSMKKYSVDNLLIFGEHIDEEGNLCISGSSGSINTIAYKKTLSLLKEAGIVSGRKKSQNKIHSHNNYQKNKGCFSVICFFLFVPITFLFIASKQL